MKRWIPLAVVAALSACEGCSEEPGPGGGDKDSLLFMYPDGNSVQSDGVTRRRVVIRARDANGDPQPASITVTRTSGDGQIAIAEQAPNADEVSGNPNADGELELDVICMAAGTLRLEADNDKVTSTGTVICNALTGDITIAVDAGDCDGLQADGTQRCAVAVTVERQSNPVVPIEGPVTVIVTDVTASPTGDGRTDDAVLDTDDVAGGLLPSITVNTDAAGAATFYVGSPEFNIEQAMTLDISVPGGPTRTIEIVIEPFNSEAAIEFITAPQSVIGGDSATFVVRATRTDGTRAATEPVTVTRSGNAGQLTGETAGAVTVTTDANGEASLTLTTSAVNSTQNVTLEASYDAIPGIVTVTGTATIEVVEADALVLNVAANPIEIRSDDPTQNTSRVTVSFTQNGATVSGGSVVATINPADQGRAIIAGAADPGTASVTLDGNGAGTLDIEAISGQLGPVTVAFVGDDGAGGELPVVREVTLSVVRDPQLQSIVFESAEPAVIGTVGGQLPSTSVVQFKLYDDQGNPMANETVTFAMPGVTDPGILLTPETALSDAGGVVRCALSAGTRAGPVVVVVTGTLANGTPLFAQSAPIAIVGGQPAAQTSGLVCDTQTVTDPFTVSCSAVVADRFTNVVPDQQVQFRAEGSVSAPSSLTGGDGVATVTFASGGFTVSGADVSYWSYGLAIPESVGDLAGFSGAAACFDGDSSTPCDLVDLCDDSDGDSANAALCPLLPDCVDDIRAATRTFLNDDPSALELALSAALRTNRDVYLADFDACGFPLGCFTGATGGASVVLGDECPVAQGCFDFTPATECPQDGLLTIIATTRGEEIFTDANGDNIYNQGIEPYIDSPEPFLDKNDNCARDDMADVSRYDGTVFQAANTDVFTDTDNNGAFGFGPAGGPYAETNGAWDSSTELMLMAHVLNLGGASLTAGMATCSTPGVDVACPSGGTAPCVETSPGQGIVDGCYPLTLADGASVTIHYRWSDDNGNCPEFGTNAGVAAEGPVLLSGTAAVTYTAGGCGFEDSPSVREPHCTSSPALGAPKFSTTVTADCDGANGPALAEITLSAGGSDPFVIVLNVACPVI